MSRNGFSGIDIVLDDYPEHLSIASVIVTTALEPQAALAKKLPREKSTVYIVYDEERCLSLIEAMQVALRSQGCDTVKISLEDVQLVPMQSRIISFIDRQAALLTTSSACFEQLRTIIKKAKSLMWISAGGLLKGHKPESAMVTGLLKTIKIEYPSLKISSIDLEPDYHQCLSVVSETIVQKEILLQQQEFGPLDSNDNNYMWSDGCYQISRLVPDDELNTNFNFRLESDFAIETRSMDSQGPIGVTFAQPGLISSLYFRPDPEFLAPLGDDWIELKTEAMGLNMKVGSIKDH